MSEKTQLATRILLLLTAVFVWFGNPKRLFSPEPRISFPLSTLKVQASDNSVAEKSGEAPLRIAIESIQLNLPVKEASVAGNDWQFHGDAISFWNESARSGEEGNLILYGHRHTHLQSLPRVRIGDRITIETEAGSRNYTVTEFKVVSPSQIEVFEQSQEEKLTLLTCTNENDADRLVIIAKPASTFGDLL